MQKKTMSPKMKQAMAALAALPEAQRKKVAARVRTTLALAELGNNPKAK